MLIEEETVDLNSMDCGPLVEVLQTHTSTYLGVWRYKGDGPALYVIKSGLLSSEEGGWLDNGPRRTTENDELIVDDFQEAMVHLANLTVLTTKDSLFG